MAEYIDKKAMLREIAKREVKMVGDRRIGIDALREFINNRPTIEIKHGHWICKHKGSYGEGVLYCSICGYCVVVSGFVEDSIKPYCANCGAKNGKEVIYENIS